MSLRPHHPRLSSLVAVVAAVATCLVLSPPALAGDPLTSIKINEVESDGLADFMELMNTSVTPTDVSGLILKDNDDSRTLAIPAATSIPAGGFLAVDTDVVGGFGMGSNDAARVFMPNGLTIIDGYGWTTHAATTYGRCPDGTGGFVTTGAVTKGAANSCTPPLITEPWPGSATVTTVDQANVLGTDVSGLDYEGSGSANPGVLWAVDNGNSLLLRLVWDGIQWVHDTANGWSAGKTLHYPGGGGLPDSEGVTLTDAGATGGVYVSSERDATNSSVSRLSVLRYDVSGAGTSLTATREWNLTPDLPPVGSNAGAESVEWVPDTALVEAGFVDEATDAPYSPATYPNHGTGLFFVGLEANGTVYAYALDQTSGSFTRVATFPTGLPTFGALHWEPATNQLWVVCDNNCEGRSAVFEVHAEPGPTQGSFVPITYYERPTGMANLNNEGFTITPASECVGGTKPVFWADDGNTGGHVLRAGTIDCSRPTTDPASDGSVRGDFNGDGVGDLAIGAPGEDVGAVSDAGVAHVLYGSVGGLTATGSQYWSQNSAGIADSVEAGDGFASTLSAGDFNGDGRDDLAIGAPGEDVGSFADGGVVHVLYGSAAGLTATGSQHWSQNAVGISDAIEAGDRFGAALAIGGLNTDGFAELVVGVPDEDIGTTVDAGVVQVIPGAASGLTATGEQYWHQNSAGVADAIETGDGFGAALAIGDLNSTAGQDLAIGAPAEDVGSTFDAGVVHVLHGSAGGATATGSQYWHQNSPGLADAVEVGDRFGSALAAGSLDSDAFAELVVGVPDEDVGPNANAGVVQVLPGAAGGLTATGSQYWQQNSAGIADAVEPGDGFGASLAIGAMNNVVGRDLAIGAPGEDVGATVDAGVVHVLFGSAAGLTATGSQYWTQNAPGLADAVEAGDRFGSALTAGTFTTSGFADLVVGVPDEDVGANVNAGVVQVLAGAASGPTATGSQYWTQNSAGIADSVEAGDGFGGALAG